MSVFVITHNHTVQYVDIMDIKDPYCSTAVQQQFNGYNMWGD